MTYTMAVGERPAPRWGVNLQGVTYADQAAREEQLARLAASGVTLGRIGISWAWTESVEGVFDWSAGDELVSAMERHGIQPLIEVSSTPIWARPAGTPETFGPANDSQRAGYSRYCGELAKHFAGRVYAYEIWNEANGGTWYPRPNVGDYSALFLEAYRAIKDSDPTVPVISTGMAGNSGFVDALPWVRAFIQTPAMALIDGLGFHPYSNGDGKVSGMLLDAGNVRQLLDQNGYDTLPMYMTETGISTGGRGGVSETMQCEVVDITGAWLDTLHDVNCVLWYCDQDSGTRQESDPGDPEGYFGLWRVDGSAKPALAHFTNLVGRTLPGGSIDASWWFAGGDSLVSLDAQRS